MVTKVFKTKFQLIECECGVVQVQYLLGTDMINLLVPKGFKTINEYDELNNAITDYIIEHMKEHMRYSISVFSSMGGFDTNVQFDEPVPVKNDGKSFIVEREVDIEDDTMLN